MHRLGGRYVHSKGTESGVDVLCKHHDHAATHLDHAAGHHEHAAGHHDPTAHHDTAHLDEMTNNGDFRPNPFPVSMSLQMEGYDAS